MNNELNREGWLTEVAHKIIPVFRGFNLRAESFRVTCGWPAKGALSRRSRRVGECHGAQNSTAGIFELFISPLLEKPLDVAGTVAHEMCHVAAGVEAGHGPGFKKVAKFVDLTAGKPTSAGPGPRLAERLERIIGSVGPYPHRAMAPQMKAAKAGSAVKLECRECGCKVIISRRWMDEVGPPPGCACGGGFGEVGAKEDSGG